MNQQANAFANDALGKMDATGVAEAIAQKRISVREAIEAAIQRTERVNPHLDAIVLKMYDEARKLDKLKQGGVFYGVPMFFKDTEDLEGYPTQLGTGAFTAQKAKANSSFARQFLSTGVACLGKTTLPEFGLLCSTEDPRWAVTRNPWNTDYTSGGSSSGSAALVASGAVPIASANDGAGSIRIPAAICGLVGLKPSRHRLHTVDGTQRMPIEVVQEGALTRSVRDTANFLAGAEQYHQNRRLPPLGSIQNPGEKRLRVAFLHNLEPGKVGHQDEDTYQLQLDTAKLLESLGHRVEQVVLPIDMDTMVEHFLNYYGFMAFMSSHLGRLILKSKVDRSQLEPFTQGLARRFKKGFWKLPRSIRALRKAGAVCSKLFDDYNVVMTPVLSHKTPKIGYFSPELSSEEVTRRAVSFATYTGLYNVTGEPAISVPMGTDSEGMPLGVQFAAPYGEEKRLIELAYELEEAKPWPILAGGHV